MFSSNVQPKRRVHARPAAPAAVRERPFVSAVARSDCPPLQRWEDEGGHYSADDEPLVETDRGKRAAPGLSWSEFLRRFFPGRRRHDLEALQAYATYRSKGTPAPSRGIRLPVAVSQKSRKEATS